MPERTPAIFISYRGSDVAWAPDLVYTELVAAFGEEAVFKAGNNLRAGDEYPPILEEMAASCPVMLVCIGPDWLAAHNADGMRRLDDARDWVRREIDLSLRNGNRVVPLLLGNFDDISIPAKQDLPEDIAQLADHQAFRLEPGSRLRITMPDLIAQLAERVPGLTRHSSHRGAGRISAALVVGTAAGKVTTVRAPVGMSHAVNVITKIDDVAETGEVTGVELL